MVNILQNFDSDVFGEEECLLEHGQEGALYILIDGGILEMLEYHSARVAYPRPNHGQSSQTEQACGVLEREMQRSRLESPLDLDYQQC